jgi:ribonuclease P protein component
LTGAAESRRFPRDSRLTNAGQFRRVFACAIRSSDRAFTLLARDNGCGRARLGLAISRKCVAHAVARNRIKRLVRESFRAAYITLPAIDIVVTCRPVVNHMTNEALTQALAIHWQRLTKRCKKY